MDALAIDGMDYMGATDSPRGGAVVLFPRPRPMPRNSKEKISPTTKGTRGRSVAPSQPLVNPIFSASLRTGEWVSAVAYRPPGLVVRWGKGDPRAMGHGAAVVVGNGNFGHAPS